MKIARMSWKNYKGLKDGAISANGDDVIISGRNGAGKSSIASVLPFVLFGKVVGSLKRYEGGLTQSDGQIHAAEVEFDDGLKLRRELHDARVGGSTTKFYINGAAVKKSEFDAQIMTLTRGGGELVINPFAFCAQPAKVQRDILLKKIGTLSEKSFLVGRAEEKLFDGMSAEVFIAQCKAELKNPKSEAQQIPARLEEIDRQLRDMPTINSVDAAEKIEATRQEIAKLQSNRAREDYDATIREIQALERRQRDNANAIKDWRTARENHLDTWRRIKKSKPGTCPTCGQRIPLEQFATKRDAELERIVALGKSAAKKINELETEAANLTDEHAKLTARAKKLLAACNDLQERDAKIKKLNRYLAELTEQETMRKLAKRQLERRKELETREKELNARIVELEGKIARAETFRQEFMSAVEEEINSRFEFVKFKLFDYLVTTGEAKPTCEATLDGVPFSALSKGEKLRAALDIFGALQDAYGVDLPLFLDDAESYSTWTLADLPPNQLFTFKVTEDELTIEIERRLGAA